MSSPKVEIISVSNVMVRQMHFVDAGDKELGHTHPFDHPSLLASGRIRLTVNGQKTEYSAPKLIYIKAQDVHFIEALEPNTVVCCIHALRNGWETDDIIDPDSIPNGVHVVPFFGVNKKWEQDLINKSKEAA
jgi:hypothetical protein